MAKKAVTIPQITIIEEDEASSSSSSSANVDGERRLESHDQSEDQNGENFKEEDYETKKILSSKSDDADRHHHHIGDSNYLECSPEEKNPLSRFLEIEHEEKVELELSRTGGLIISPSSAYLYGLVKSKESVHHHHRHPEKDKTKFAWRGILFGISASFFFSLSVIMVKMLPNSHELNTSVFRYTGIFLPSIPIVLYYEVGRRWTTTGTRCCQRKPQQRQEASIFRTLIPLTDKDKMMNFCGLMGRGFLGCTSVLLRFYSLRYLSVADSSVISYSGPVFVVIVAHFCLGEKCGFVPIVAALLTAIGVFVIARPPIFTGKEAFEMKYLIGTALALVSMICNSTVIILMRKIRKVHFAVMLLTFGSWGFLESLVVAGSWGVLTFPNGVRDSLLMLLVLPALVFFGQMSIILAMKFENAGPISLIRSCDVLFSFVWQFLFLHQSPEAYSLIGAFIVVLCVALTTIRKWVSGLPQGDAMRKKFAIFLM